MTAITSSTLTISKVLGEKTIYLLDIPATNLQDSVPFILKEIENLEAIDESQYAIIKKQLQASISKGPAEVSSGVALYHRHSRALKSPIQILIRFTQPLAIWDVDDVPTRFVWILLSTTPTHPLIKAVSQFFHLMGDSTFRKKAMSAPSSEDLVNIYVATLEHRVYLSSSPVAQDRTAYNLMGGIKEDLQHRLPYWFKDFRSGLSIKVLASILFMFFACAAPAVAFGALIHALTGGQIGVIETILASAICGMLWSLFGGQPLVIIGATGPNVIFTGILYTLCVRLDIPFLPITVWVGLWTMLFLFLLAAVNASVYIRYFTRFTDEIFAALISLIFISEAIADLVRIFHDEQVPNDSALLSLLLAIGTFTIAISLSRVRRSPYLRHYIREFLSDFSPTIALVSMTLLAYQFSDITFEKLSVPDTFKASIDRSWLINPFEAPFWTWFASMLPAALLTILIWVNQNITARLVNSPDHKLRRGTAYHWDIACIGFLVGLMSLFGLPWVVGAAVRSLNHVRSLLIMQGERVRGAVENRLSNLSVHTLMLFSLFALSALQYMPMAVLYGIFLFMGIGSMAGNQFVERLQLWFVDPKLFHLTHHLRAVPINMIHLYTVVQFTCLTILWIVKSSIIGILFPFFVALLVPLRILLARFFEPEYVALLDMEEGPEDERYREFGI